MKTKQLSRILAMALVLVMVLGTVPMAVFATESAAITRWNVTLTDDLRVNFYIEVPESDVENTQIQLAVGDSTPIAYNVSELDANGEGYYVVSTNIAAAQMTDTINVVITTAGAEIANKNYTVAGYAAIVLADEASSKYHDLVRNLLNYGAKAQLYFDHNTNALANAGYEMESAASISSEAQMVIDGSVSGISFYGATLLFQNKIAMRYYFTAPNGVEGYTFTVGDASYEVMSSEGLYYVEIPGINPRDYNENVTLSVSDGENVLSITYSPMCYITRMYTKETASNALKNLLVAMYGYHLAACAMPDPTPEEFGYTRVTLAGLGVADGTYSGNKITTYEVTDGIGGKYVDVDVTFGEDYDAYTGIKIATSSAAAWDGLKIGLNEEGNMVIQYCFGNKNLRVFTPEQVGLTSFYETFNLKVAVDVANAETAAWFDVVFSMWINDKLVTNHMLIGDIQGIGNFAGVMTWGSGKVTVSSVQTPEEMGYTRYTMADLGIEDGTYADNKVRGGIPAAGVNNGYLDVDVAFAYKPDGAADTSTGIKIAHTGAASWDGLQIRLADGDKLTVRDATSNYELFSVTTEEAGVETFTDTFNLKVATKFEDYESGKLVTVSLWINDKQIKKNCTAGLPAKNFGEYSGILTWFGGGITLSTPVAEENPEETEPVQQTPEDMGYTRFTLESLGIADGAYAENKGRTAEVPGGINGKYLDVDVSFDSAFSAAAGIKIANTAASGWDGIKIGMNADGNLTINYAVSNKDIQVFTPEELGLSSLQETFNLKVAVDLVDSAIEGRNDITLTMWVNDVLYADHVLFGGVTGLGNFAGIMTYGASVTVASESSPEELGYTRLTLADLGIADGIYNTNAVTTAECPGGINDTYLDVDVAFGYAADGTADPYSGIKIANTAPTSWDGIRIALDNEDKLTVRYAASNAEIFSLTAAEAGVDTFTETFNLKVAVKLADSVGNCKDITISMWINDVVVKKNILFQGYPLLGNFAGVMSWNGAPVIVATPVEN